MLGLDVGTTAVKVVACPLEAPEAVTGAVASSTQEYATNEPHPGWQEQDPAGVLSGIDAAVADCVGQLRDVEVVALSVSTAMHGLIGLDQDCRPLTPLITWADSRAAPEARQLRADGLAGELLRLTGTPVHPMSPLLKLRWFTTHQAHFAAGVRWWVGLKDYVLHHLTGELITELSSASATGLLDLRSRDWAEESLELGGICRSQLPAVLPTTTVLELTAGAAQALGLPPGLPVAVGAADGPLGNLGTGAIETGVAGLSLGTSGAVRMVVSQPSFDAAGRLFCYALTDDVWVVGGAVSNGGSALRWAGHTFAPELTGSPHADADLLELAAKIPAGSEGLVLLPFLLSERAPLWDPDLAGAFLGLRHHHTRSHFLRATLEGVCLQMSTLVDALDSVAPVQSLRATGGPFRAELWRQVMAATLGRPLSVQADAGGTALGAAALGWYALGGAASLAEALVAVGGPRPDAAPKPVIVADADRDAYRALRSTVPALLSAYGEVAHLFAPAGAMTQG